MIGRSWLAPDLADDGEAVHRAQHQVDDHQVRRRPPRPRHGLLPARPPRRRRSPRPPAPSAAPCGCGRRPRRRAVAAPRPPCCHRVRTRIAARSRTVTESQSAPRAIATSPDTRLDVRPRHPTTAEEDGDDTGSGRATARSAGLETDGDEVTVRLSDDLLADGLADVRWLLHDALLAGARRSIVDLSRRAGALQHRRRQLPVGAPHLPGPGRRRRPPRARTGGPRTCCCAPACGA